MPISDFPNEIFRIIFDYLPVTDAHNCVFVSKSWRFLATPASWREVRFRIAPWNNKLASLLRRRLTTLQNFRFTTHLTVDLDYSRKSSDPLWVDWDPDPVELLRPIITNLPIRFHALKVIFHCNTFDNIHVSTVLCPLLPLAERAILGVQFLFLSSDYTSLSSKNLKDVMPFFPMLTDLAASARWLLDLQFPPMPRVTNCKIENGRGFRVTEIMNVFSDSPLETLSLSNMYTWRPMDLPRTITSLSLIDIHGSTLHMAFYLLPNLRNLALEFQEHRYFHDSLIEVRPSHGIVSTELYAYTSSAVLPLWLSERIGNSCRNLSSIHFKGVLAKYSRNVSPFLRHFRDKKQTSIIHEQSKSSWEALLLGKGGNHFIFFDETFRKNDVWESEWQLRRSFRASSAPGDITELLVKNQCIYMTTFTEEEQKAFDLSGFWTGLDTHVETSSKDAEFWELIRIDEYQP